jgi:hypothetical protein
MYLVSRSEELSRKKKKILDEMLNNFWICIQNFRVIK